MPSRPRPALVGRLDELARVSAALGGDDGGAVLLGGDAGIGKSALVGRVVEDAAGRVLLGHCVGEAGTTLPYLPFVEMVAGLDARERDLVDELVAAHPGLVPLVPRLAGGARGDAVRADLVEAVHATLAELGRRGPVLVVVEDVHWADESTRELLSLLFTRGAPEGVGLLATWRTDDIHRRHPLAAALALWSRLPSLTRVELGPLPDADLRQVVRRAAADLGPRVVEDVARRAEGNAFFAEELAAAAGAGGVDAGDLTRLLLTRVDQLDDDAQSVVRVAAVIGRRVPHALLERVAAVPPGVLRTALRAALEHHVLEPWADRGYEFRHALLAEAVSEDLLPHERVQLHRACADALLEDPGLGSDAALARHALASGDRTLALTAAVRAGDSARRMGGPAEALAHFETALGLVDVEAPEVHTLTLRAAGAANAAGRPMRAMTLLRSRLAGTAPSPRERAELLGALAFASRMTEERVDREALTAEALTLLDDDAPAPLRVGLLTRRAEVLTDVGATTEALAVADEAMALAVQHDLLVDRADLSSVLVRLGEAAGDPGEAMRRLEAVVAEWTDAPDLALLRAMHVLASIHLRRGDYRAALEGFEREHAEARRAGLEASVFGTDGRAFAVTAAHEMGDWDLAVRLVADAATAGLPAGGLAGVESAGSYVPAARGSLDPEALLAAARPWWSEDGRIAAQAGAVAVDVLGRAGRLERMLEVRDEVVAHLRSLWSMPRVPVEVRVAALALGHIGSVLRERPTAERRRLLEVAEELASDAAAVWGPGSSLPDPSLEGEAWVARARAEALRVRWAGGAEVAPQALVEAWREVVELFDRRAEPYEVARVRARLAEVLTAAGDPTGAAEQVAAARAVAERLGARPLLEDLDRLGAGPRPGGTTLTAREHEVLTLLAAGRSNGEVGRALFISTKTASVHVSNILAKLGAGSRGEAVALAREAGLLGEG
ncbi:helix-turn-helix transcriptional regulator [Phycicoccus avicenniae]|uniref:helix-turn-helix transcriptional regulator n=1 Tax=Phycicoccus avicenniae TaxID=2828860 RepID=UPI003D2AB573